MLPTLSIEGETAHPDLDFDVAEGHKQNIKMYTDFEHKVRINRYRYNCDGSEGEG